MGIPEIEKAIARNRAVFGNTFADYLLGRLDELQSEEKPPLSAAFYLRLPQGEGRSTETERNYEIAESVERIRLDLKHGRLRDRALRVLSNESERLFPSIEKHLRVVGYRSHDTLDYRRQLAATIVDITSLHGKSAKTAARIFIECMKTRQAMLIEICRKDDLPATERAHLKVQIQVLNSYGAMPTGKGKSGTSLSGVQRVHKDFKGKMPKYFLGLQTSRDEEQSATLLAENDPTSRNALNIINSPDVGDHNRKELQKLQKRTSKEHQHIWPTHWAEYTDRALTNAKKISRPT